jgi:hypothetical protein
VLVLVLVLLHAGIYLSKTNFQYLTLMCVYITEIKLKTWLALSVPGDGSDIDREDRTTPEDKD